MALKNPRFPHKFYDIIQPTGDTGAANIVILVGVGVPNGAALRRCRGLYDTLVRRGSGQGRRHSAGGDCRVRKAGFRGRHEDLRQALRSVAIRAFAAGNGGRPARHDLSGIHPGVEPGAGRSASAEPPGAGERIDQVQPENRRTV